MIDDAKSFFRRFQTGVDVAIAVADQAPDKVFGVRDGFQRFFRHSLERDLPVTVHQVRVTVEDLLPMSGEETLGMARSRAEEADQQADGHAFAVGSESGLMAMTAAGESRFFVLNWTVVRGVGDEAWGSSGGLQLPSQLIDGLDDADIPFAVPGTRRSGGMASSLTGGVESRRTAAATATFNALCSLFYGRLGVRPRN